MKKFKKANLLLFTLILMFCFSGKVLATDTKSGQYGDITLGKTTMNLVQYTRYGNNSATNLIIADKSTGNTTTNGKNLPYYQYYDGTRAVNYGQSWLAVYCLDPATWSSNYNLKANRFLLADGTSKWLGTYDTTLMYALTYDTNQYAAKSIAIRTLTTMFKSNHNATASISNNFYSASYELFASFYGLAIDWVENDSDISESYKKLEELIPNGVSAVETMKQGSLAISDGKFVGTKNYGYNSYILSSYSSSYTDNVAIAKEIVKGALKLAVEYAENYGEEASVTTNVAVGKRTPSTIDDTTDEISYQETHNFTLKNFTIDDKANFTITDLKYDNGYEESGASSEPYIVKISVNNTVIYDKANNIGTFNYNENILEYEAVKEAIDSDSDSDITISVTVEGLTTYSIIKDYSCNDLKTDYSLYYHYDDSSLSNNQFDGLIGVIWYPSGTNGQRFISVEEVSDYDDSDSNEGKDGVSSSAMQFLNCGCDELKLACEESIDEEGTDDTTACKDYYENCDTCETIVSNDFQCCDENNEVILLDGEKHLSIEGPSNPVACFARSDVSATDEAGNSYEQESNRYCRVSCKEDYDFYMPSSKKANSGSYFTFGMRIEGTKTCYTDGIDTTQYETDITEVQHDLVDYYNEYAYNTAALIAFNNATPTTISCGQDKEGSQKTYSWTFTKYDYNGIKTDNANYYTTSSGTTYRAYATVNNCNDSYNVDYSDKISEASGKIPELQKEYQQYIDDYNDCSEWDNVYTFDPEINYEYEETYDYNHENPNMEDYNVSKYDDNKASVWYCNGTLSDETYDNCSGESDTITDSSMSTVKVDVKYVYCTTDGCDSKTEQIYNNTYVKKTATVEAYYRPKTLFYYIKDGNGTVTTDSSEENIEPVTNGLPISRSTSRNFYYYGIKITNLGEFYSGNQKGTLGRLVGAEGSVAETEEFKEKTNFVNGNIEYDCTYLVNMGTFEGSTLVCDFTKCTGEGCDFSCVGPGCQEECSGDGCSYTCLGTGCIYNEGEGSTYYERQIKLDDLFVDGTDSRNWNVNGVEGLKDKAAATIDEIESLGEEVYNGDPILSVTISPSAASSITSYNKNAESEGGYSNSTIECYDLNGYVNGACYSTFITELLDGEYKVTVNAESKIQADNNYRVVGAASGNTGEYFEAWTDLSANGLEPSEMVVGPSWK